MADHNTALTNKRDNFPRKVVAQLTGSNGELTRNSRLPYPIIGPTPTEFIHPLPCIPCRIEAIYPFQLNVLLNQRPLLLLPVFLTANPDTSTSMFLLRPQSLPSLNPNLVCFFYPLSALLTLTHPLSPPQTVLDPLDRAGTSPADTPKCHRHLAGTYTSYTS